MALALGWLGQAAGRPGQRGYGYSVAIGQVSSVPSQSTSSLLISSGRSCWSQ
ncbi:hypothetical protein ACGFSB_32645 [Streptomyces sp. NPDC048441]|uniref:hypothetical protein n=1 Tax=Streptomyces sp. NPDC048441 TaxID=3365552 RepID=UPI00371E5C6A